MFNVISRRWKVQEDRLLVIGPSAGQGISMTLRIMLSSHISCGSKGVASLPLTSKLKRLPISYVKVARLLLALWAKDGMLDLSRIIQNFRKRVSFELLTVTVPDLKLVILET
jgi:hypothetical protein